MCCRLLDQCDADLQMNVLDCLFKWREIRASCTPSLGSRSEVADHDEVDDKIKLQYYFLIRLMGRKASHVALECTLQSHPNMVILAEEVADSKLTLFDITKQICDTFQARGEQDKHHGVILLPEGLIESFPEVYALLQLLLHPESDDSTQLSQIGKTKVFLRAGQMAELDSVLNQVLGKSPPKIQRIYLTYPARKSFLSSRMTAVQIQALCRGQVARCIYERKRRTAAASIIQKDARMFVSRRTYTRIRGMVARNELLFRKRNTAVVVIQSHCRRRLNRRSYSNMKGATIAIQCACRATMACIELKKLKKT
ncbi:hypothetical protein ACS0TY_017618 [Phlomoides rotata]